MTGKPPNSLSPADHSQILVADLVKRIARGDIDAVDDLFGLPSRPGISPQAVDLAESIGLILVRLEAGDFYLEQATEAENRLKHLNKLKDEHLAIAAHDLRNPLYTIRCLSQLLAHMELDEEKREKFTNSIFRVSDQMLYLVNNILDVAVIDSDTFALEIEAGNLSALISERVEFMMITARDKGVRLVANLDDVPDTRFDVGRINQVVDNLLSNAVKFSPTGSTVHIRCETEGKFIKIFITDEGPGIPAGELDSLFETFHKASVRPTAGEKGTGLGLSIAKRLVEAHNGRIWVESNVGHGSTFAVSIPIVIER